MHKKSHISSYLKGILSEIYVLCFLIAKGYKPIKWRMRNAISEIDLIVQKNKILIAIEVKYRTHYDDGLYAITHKLKQNIRLALDLFYTNQKYFNYDLRCDVCIVNRRGFIKHLKNAF